MVIRKITVLLLLMDYCSTQDYRLPNTVAATSYDLSLTLDPQSDNYTGTVTITFRANLTSLNIIEDDDSITITTDINDISLHADGNFITIQKVVLNKNISCTVGTPNEVGMTNITCPSPIENGDNSMYIEFMSKFSTNDGYGLVKYTYINGDTEQIIIESNFKPTFARRAFPCFDEPDFKAAFKLQITHPKVYIAISNSPQASSAKIRDDMATTTFEMTPKISPHLLSIFVSQFHEAKTDAEDKIDFKIYTRPEVTSSSTNIANTYYHQIIQKLGEFTGAYYETLNEKESYLVAVPDYSEAMADFGLFAVKETDVLDEGDKTKNIAKQNILKAMTYKLCHEWYGGNVATKWWSDVWANEAVAAYLKYVVANEVDSELDLMNQFLVEVNQKMLHSHGYYFAKPLSSSESDIGTEWTIENQLNTDIYEKGASILHMINLILGGKEQFQSSLQNHWKNRKDADTNGTDILKDLLAGKTDEGTEYYTYLEKWAFSAGFPLISVRLVEENDTDAVNITQKRFLYSKYINENDDASGWYVPLTAATNISKLSDIKVSRFLKPDEELMYCFNHGTWLTLNVQGGGFYRVNYDEKLWKRIFAGLRNDREQFHVIQRSQLLDDIFSIARIDEVDYSFVFEMADLLVNETEYYPWYSAFNAFSYLIGKMGSDENEFNLQYYILNLMKNIIKIPSGNFIEDSDSHIDVLKKVLVLEWACYLGHKDCIKYTTEKFNSYKETQTSLEDYNARDVILCNGIRYSTNLKEDWDFLWNVYKNSLSVHEQSDILKSLGCARDSDVLYSYLQKIISPDSGIKRQDAMAVFNSVLISSHGIYAARSYLQYNFTTTYDFFKNMQVLSEMIFATAKKLVIDEEIDWLELLLKYDILDRYDDIKSTATILAAVNNRWQKNFQQKIADILPAALTTESPDTTNPSDTPKLTPTTEPVTTSTPSTTTESKSSILSLSHYILILSVIYAVLLM